LGISASYSLVTSELEFASDLNSTGIASKFLQKMYSSSTLSSTKMNSPLKSQILAGGRAKSDRNCVFHHSKEP
jgi:hypothetical protein